MSRLLFFFSLFVCFLPPLPSFALSGEWQRKAEVSVRLVSGVEGTGNAVEIPLGLDIDLEPGWHTYWRSPGETGLPPQFDWSASLNETGNLESVQILYPTPKRIQEQSLETAGYDADLLLPIIAQVREPGRPLKISASLDILVCNKICVPRRFDLRLDIPSGEAATSPEYAYIEKWRALIPTGPGVSRIAITNVQRNPTDIFITFTRARDGADPEIFVESEAGVIFAKPEPQEIGADTASFVLKPAAALPEGVSLRDTPVTVTIVDGAESLEQKLDASSPPATLNAAENEPLSAPPGAPLWMFVIMAVIGGFILNLTPCVLPVLSLKIVGVVAHGGGEKRAIRRSFLTTAAGIMFSFLVLAAATLALKETGRAVGWGVQFQQPGFLGFLLLLLSLFAANLLGLFEIALPRFLADRLDPLYHPKMAGDFVTGAFATLLSTPCSVPFLGTAVGFALAAGAKEILAVFTALGFGMAIPYLAVALRPGLASLLPKPGRWMIILRRVLGAALALTAVWLLYVLKAEMPLWGVAAVAACVLTVVLVMHMQAEKPWSNTSRAVVVFALFAAFGVALASGPPEDLLRREDDLSWRPFDEKAISRYVKQGKTVFVDVTADWCVNCKANKKFVLEREEVQSCLFSSPDIVAMRADWTNPNPSIGAFLRRHRRSGIPFNVVFGPEAPQGVVLPELLTPSIVREGLEKAHKKPFSC